MNDKQTPDLELSIKALPTALFSARHLSTLLTSSGVVLPAWISASSRRVRGGRVNGATVASHARFSGVKTDSSDCEPNCQQKKRSEISKRPKQEGSEGNRDAPGHP